jgi:hypothetical protein
MKHHLLAKSVALVTVWLPLATAHAACDVANLEDRWDAYAMGVDFGVAYWQRCTLRINDRGRFQSGSSCGDSEGENSVLSSSDFRLRRNCVLTGSFKQTFDEISVRCDVRATLSSDKQIVSGVGECDDGEIFLFNMVRR